ncbi:MAG: hypothetical protein Q4E51_08695, partial [Lachnospiraceae bacterium]|nr:hypothetical protein [Lachnospiraceae bacterium]
MNKVGTWHGFEVYGVTKKEFEGKSTWDHMSLFLIDNKYLVGFKNDFPEIIGQLEPDGTVFEYARSTP